ncbi:hypothetical protein V1478_008193 [Vespula squamosa]|uniref:Uncharacterized protein n=1 Tax=Vespula squamosa TaxID=30214 RepID=A0ABD2AYG0_VESSQ
MEEEASKEGWLDFDFDNDYDEEKEEEEEKLVKEVKEEEEEGSDRLWISECQSTSSSRLALLHRKLTNSNFTTSHLPKLSSSTITREAQSWIVKSRNEPFQDASRRETQITELMFVDQKVSLNRRN